MVCCLISCNDKEKISRPAGGEIQANGRAGVVGDVNDSPYTVEDPENLRNRAVGKANDPPRIVGKTEQIRKAGPGAGRTKRPSSPGPCRGGGLSVAGNAGKCREN